jgi:hypothetical protein
MKVPVDRFISHQNGAFRSPSGWTFYGNISSFSQTSSQTKGASEHPSVTRSKKDIGRMNGNPAVERIGPQRRRISGHDRSRLISVCQTKNCWLRNQNPHQPAWANARPPRTSLSPARRHSRPQYSRHLSDRRAQGSELLLHHSLKTYLLY